MLTFAETLAQWRARQHLTIRQAADELGVLQQTYVQWESGHVPDVEVLCRHAPRTFTATIQRAAGALDLSIVELLSRMYLPDRDLPDGARTATAAHVSGQLDQAIAALVEHLGGPRR